VLNRTQNTRRPVAVTEMLQVYIGCSRSRLVRNTFVAHSLPAPLPSDGPARFLARYKFVTYLLTYFCTGTLVCASGNSGLFVGETLDKILSVFTVSDSWELTWNCSSGCIHNDKF